jgi:hypothetical protein
MRLVFDGFEIDPQGCQLWRGGAEVALEPRALDLLCYLATRPGQLVRKEDLLAEVWDAKTLSDGVLSNTIGKLRRALGQDSHENTPIETVRGRGYRWRALAQAPPLPAAEPAPPRERATDFVGRRAVLDEFVKALERSTGLTLIVGETGIGKTRALAELARLARARGYTVWCGSAYDGAGAPAYWPWIEILRAAHAELSELAWQRHLPRDPRGLGLLVPEFVSATRSAGADEQAERFRIFDEVSRFLAAVSGEAPRLIVLDDMHWADATSLELLAFAARALEQAKRPVLFAAGLRDRDVSLSPAQRATIQRLERLGTRVALAGLELDEVSELVLRQSRDSLERGLARSRRQPADAEREQLGSAADGGEVSASAESAARVHQALQRRTQGNPFFILQILGWLAQRSLPADLTNIASSALPAAVEGVIRQRIALLAGPARAALSAAAAIGHEFDAALLARVLERGVDEIARRARRGRRRARALVRRSAALPSARAQPGRRAGARGTSARRRPARRARGDVAAFRRQCGRLQPFVGVVLVRAPVCRSARRARRLRQPRAARTPARHAAVQRSTPRAARCLGGMVVRAHGPIRLGSRQFAAANGGQHRRHARPLRRPRPALHARRGARRAGGSRGCPAAVPSARPARGAERSRHGG